MTTVKISGQRWWERVRRHISYGSCWSHIVTTIHWYYTWQSKEEGNISILPHIAARMQGEDLSLRHEIMHNTEKTLLHFPSILSAEDNHFPPSKIKIYASGGCHVVGVTITRKLASIVYSEVRSTEILQLFRSGSDTPETHPVIDCTLRLIHIPVHVFFTFLWAWILCRECSKRLY